MEQEKRQRLLASVDSKSIRALGGFFGSLLFFLSFDL